MDPTYTEEAEAFRTRIKDFLDANLPCQARGRSTATGVTHSCSRRLRLTPTGVRANTLLL